MPVPSLISEKSDMSHGFINYESNSKTKLPE
jgi:hypothetical protein